MGKRDNERAENAFRIWCTTGEQDDAKTAALCEIPYSTVTYYRRSHRWAERWQETIGPEAEILSVQARTIMRMATPMIARRLLKIVGGTRPLINADGNIVRDDDGNPVLLDYAENRDAINAAKLLASYVWGDPRNVIFDTGEGTQSQLGSILNAEYTPLPEGDDSESPENLEALKQSVSSIIEATMQSVNTRTTMRKGMGKRV